MADHNGRPVAYIAPPNSDLASPSYRLASQVCSGILPPPITAAYAQGQQ